MKKIEIEKFSRFTTLNGFDFSKQSSIGCGGRPQAAFVPQSVAELTALLAQLNEGKIAYRVLGNLTNVLPPDGDSDLVVVSMKGLQEMRFGEKVFVQAGVSSGKFLAECRRKDRQGAEFLSGVPCTLGGALYMNAGAGGKYISEIVDEVLVLRKGKEESLSLRDCQYAYKHSIFMENEEDIVLGAWLRMEKGTPEQIDEATEYYLQRRKHLPKGKSMGCVFKNPVGGFAGDLIERSGLKGYRLGGVKISEQHANFIINDEGGTAKEIRGLIALIKDTVYANCGVRLEEEIRYL